VTDLSVQMIWQGVVNGFALGWIYVLMALGLTLIFGIMGILQFAHGEIYMLGAYGTYYLTASAGLPLFPAILISVALMSVFGIFLERYFFRRMRGQLIPPIVFSLGLTLILTSFAGVKFGLFERTVPPLATGSINVLGSLLPADRLVAVAVSVFLTAGLYLFLKRSRYGLAMVAAAQSPEGTLLQGISPNLMSGLAMALACALAASAGALAGSLLMLGPYMGLLPLIKGLVIIVLGGMGSLLGAVVGGMILGFIDGLIPIIFGDAVSSIMPLVLVILVLLFKPQGLFGRE